MAGHDGLQVHESDAQGGLGEDLRGWKDGAEARAAVQSRGTAGRAIARARTRPAHEPGGRGDAAQRPRRAQHAVLTARGEGEVRCPSESQFRCRVPSNTPSTRGCCHHDLGFGALLRAGGGCAPRRAPRDVVAREPGVRARPARRSSVLRSPRVRSGPRGGRRAPRGCARHETQTECHAPCVCTAAAVPSSCFARRRRRSSPPRCSCATRRREDVMSSTTRYFLPKSHRAGWTRLAISALTSRSLSITSSSAAPESSPRTPSASLEYSSRVASNAARSAASEASSVAAPRPAGRAGSRRRRRERTPAKK